MRRRIRHASYQFPFLNRKIQEHVGHDGLVVLVRRFHSSIGRFKSPSLDKEVSKPRMFPFLNRKIQEEFTCDVKGLDRLGVSIPQ